MKKVLLMLVTPALIVLLVTQCRKSIPEENQLPNSTSEVVLQESISLHSIGGDTTEPNLLLAAYNGTTASLNHFQEYGIQPQMPQVVRNAIVSVSMASTYGWHSGDTMDLIRLWCLSENVAPRIYSIKRDQFDSTNFRFNELTDAEVAYDDLGRTVYLLNGFLKAGTFVNGNKVAPSQYKYRYEPSYDWHLPELWDTFYNGRTYPANVFDNSPVMGLPAQSGDLYINYFPVPRGYNGLVSINPTINPEYGEDKRVSHESNYYDNTQVLSFYVNGSSITYTTELPFPLTPPLSVSASPSQLGQPKKRSFTISWNSPNNDWFCVWRTIMYSNGTFLDDHDFKDVYGAKSFVDASPEIQAGNIKKIIYTVFVMTEGMAPSMGRTVGIEK